MEMLAGRDARLWARDLMLCRRSTRGGGGGGIRMGAGAKNGAAEERRESEERMKKGPTVEFTVGKVAVERRELFPVSSF